MENPTTHTTSTNPTNPTISTHRMGSFAVTVLELHTIIAVVCETFAASYAWQHGHTILTLGAGFGILLSLAIAVIIGLAYYKG